MNQPAVDPRRDELVERLVEHCSAMSVTGDEAALCDALEATYLATSAPVRRVGDSLVIGAPDPGERDGGPRPLVLLVGHLDVVPPTDDDRAPRRAEVGGRDAVIGRGSSDMKSGNVVAMSLFDDEELRDTSPYAVAMVLYAREEGPAHDNELGDVLDEVPWLGSASLAVVLEPTDGQVQVGCLGALNLLITVTGKQAHSARPWQGASAVDKALPLLVAAASREPEAVEVDGITYQDTLTATQVWTDSARNVVPGEVRVNLNHRFAPSRSMDEAEAALIEWVRSIDGMAEADLEVVDRAAPAPPKLTEPAVADFVTRVGAEVAAKQAWTDVARFAQIGVAACNYGPGLTSQAHQRGEYVFVDDLVDAWQRLRAFLAG